MPRFSIINSLDETLVRGMVVMDNWAGLEPAPPKLESFHCMLCEKDLNTENSVKYHLMANHKDMKTRERSQLKELIIYGKLKYQ